MKMQFEGVPCLYPVPWMLSSASSRIPKGQGYQGFLRKRAGSSFGQKKAIYGQNFTPFRVNKMFSLKF
jgi:hypothetical protein